MNLQDLVTKLRIIEDGEQVAPVHTDAPVEQEGIEIIGGPMPPHAPEQPDNVSMNVSLNGQGAGGVRNLMKILHDIENGVSSDSDHTDTDHNIDHALGHNDVSDEPLMGDMIKAMVAHEEVPEPEMEEEMGDDGETWENSAHGDAGAHVHGVDAVTPTGDDLGSVGGSSPLARAPGSNTMIHYHESIVNKLTAMYEEIKGEPMSEEKKTMSRAAKGNEKYGKDGMKALAKAGRDGASEKKLDAIRDKHDNYNENINESADILKLSKMLNG